MDFNPAMMMQGCGPMQGNNQMQQMFQFMQIMQLMQMMQQFGGGQRGIYAFDVQHQRLAP